MARDKFKSFGRGSERPLPAGNAAGFAEAPGASFVPEGGLAPDRDTWAGALQGDPANWPLFAPHRPERPEKSEGGRRLNLVSEYQPAGDQPTAIAELVEGVNKDEREQVLLGVTGSGKTYTMAQVIERTQRPALVLAPNKTLAAQLYGEFKSFFPENAVEYFVSYYDYYQPEAYVPRTDTYIEKESSINEQIDRMRPSATRALLERDDVIIVASVSCIYGIGSVETYSAMTFAVKVGERLDRKQLIADLVALQYKRNDQAFGRGTFRVRGDTVEVFPAHYEDRAWRISLFGDEVEEIAEFDPLTGHKTDSFKEVKLYANSHYVTPRPTLNQAIEEIKHDLQVRLQELKGMGKLLEAQRLEQRTQFDIESFIFCFAIGGIGAVLYHALTGQSFVPVHVDEKRAPRHRFHPVALWAPYVLFGALYFFPWNPIYPAILSMLIGGIASGFCRPDLKTKGLVGGAVFLGLYSVFMLGLVWLTPGYIPQVWNLPALSGILIGGIPLEELVFGFSFGWYWTGVYEHFTWSTGARL